jgi:hypothetical protein
MIPNRLGHRREVSPSRMVDEPSPKVGAGLEFREAPVQDAQARGQILIVAG